MSETGFVDNWCASFHQATSWSGIEEVTDQDQFVTNTGQDESPTGYPVGDHFLSGYNNRVKRYVTQSISLVATLFLSNYNNMMCFSSIFFLFSGSVYGIPQGSLIALYTIYKYVMKIIKKEAKLHEAGTNQKCSE